MGRPAYEPAQEGMTGGLPARPCAAAPLGDLRFARLLGAAAWAALPPATRARFGRRVGLGEAVVYRGVTLTNETTRRGRLLAHAARLLGAPLPLPDVTPGGAAVVSVTEAPGGQGWTRCYARPNGFPQVVRSAKAFAGPTGIEEVVGLVGMALRVRTAGQALLFEHDHYFLRVFGLTLRLPRWLGPGLAVTHEEAGAGGGAFLFTLTLGRPARPLLRQTALFRDEVTT